MLFVLELDLLLAIRLDKLLEFDLLLMLDGVVLEVIEEELVLLAVRVLARRGLENAERCPIVSTARTV